jgi:hypothetical protein
MRPLRLAGAMKVAEGVTTLDGSAAQHPGLGSLWKPHRGRPLESERIRPEETPGKSQGLLVGLMFTGGGLRLGLPPLQLRQLGSGPGPGYFPFGLGVLLAVLGGLVLLQGHDIEAEDGERIGAIAWKPLAVMAASLPVRLALPRLGMPLTLPCCLAGELASRENHCAMRWRQRGLALGSGWSSSRGSS